MLRKTPYEAWPFLIGKSLTHPTEVIVIPRPLYAAKIHGLLGRVATPGDNLTSYGYLYYRTVLRPDSSVLFSLIFHAIQATSHFIGFASDSPLTDGQGRPIHLIEGFVFPGDIAPPLITGSAFLALHALLLRGYRRFWTSEENESSVSDGWPIQANEAEVTLGTLKLDPYTYDFGPLNWTSSPTHVGRPKLDDGQHLSYPEIPIPDIPALKASATAQVSGTAPIQPVALSAQPMLDERQTITAGGKPVSSGPSVERGRSRKRRNWLVELVLGLGDDEADNERSLRRHKWLARLFGVEDY